MLPFLSVEDENDFVSGVSPSMVAMVLMFGSITFTVAAMAAKTWLLGDSRAIMAVFNFTSTRKDAINPLENSFVSIFVLLYHLMIFGLILFISYILEHHPPFPHGNRSAFDPDYLVFLGLVLMAFALTSWQLNAGFHRTKKSVGKVDAGRSQDGQATIASGLPTLPSRRSNRSGRSSRSGISSAEDDSDWLQTSQPSLLSRRSGGSSNGSVEDIDLQQDDRPSMLDTLEEESTPPSITDSSLLSIHHGRSQDDTMEDAQLAGNEIFSNESRRPKKKEHVSAPETTEMNLLNIHQTLEWKGLLSSLFLMYQLTRAESHQSGINVFYNASQVGASFFIFLSGFGHAMYFYSRNNYRFARVLRVLFRLNMTVFFLCFTLGHPYIYYYACPLHSGAFLMTYGVMRVNQGLNYSKYGLRIKLLGLVGCIFAVWDFPSGLFDLFFNPFFSRGPKSTGFPNGPLWEWYSHTHMHHWAVFVGIVYALNYPITSLLLYKTELLNEQRATLSKGTIGISLAVALAFWVSGPFVTPRLAFDSTHPYFVFLPILSYVYFRNSTSFLRQRHIGLLKTLGACTLEMYLFHHHFLLANGGDSVLVLVPGYPKCNVLVTCLLLVLVSRLVSRLTSVLCGMMLPADNEGKCVRSLLSIGACALGFYGASFALHTMDLLNSVTVMVATVAIGFVVYQTILDMTWQEYQNVGRHLVHNARDDNDESPISKASPPLIGTMVILALGLSWHITSMAGATQGSITLLPGSCEVFANDGIWAPVSACSEFQRGKDTRELQVGGCYRNCEETGTMLWGWRETKSNSRCMFRWRSRQDLLQKLSYRKVVFIGDLMMRSLFHAFSRALGDVKAGEYDATRADHADFSRVVNNVRMEYKWAPLASDQVTKLKDIRTKDTAGQNRPDLILVGGGTLDRLHVWATDEDHESHKVAVQKLAKELDFSASATIWCTPTTVNTAALSNDEKRNQMNEMAISEVRKMYAELEVESSANFVLDGPSYSRGRVAESFDGIMYPHSVYDVGIQIVANSLDWLLPEEDGARDVSFDPPAPGSMSNPFLGLMMACFGLIGLFFFDGYFGFSYLSSLFVQNSESSRRRRRHTIVPTDLYEEAFVPYHNRLKLPRRKTGSRKGERGDEYGADILSLLDNSSGGSMTRRRQG